MGARLARGPGRAGRRSRERGRERDGAHSEAADCRLRNAAAVSPAERPGGPAAPAPRAPRDSPAHRAPRPRTPSRPHSLRTLQRVPDKSFRCTIVNINLWYAGKYLGRLATAASNYSIQLKLLFHYCTRHPGGWLTTVIIYLLQ